MNYSFPAICLSVILSVVSSQANAKSSETVKDYSTKVRDATIQFEKLAKEARGNKDVVLKNQVFVQSIAKFGLTGPEQARIAQAIADGKTSVITAVYSSLAARDLIDRKEIETADMDAGLLSLVRTASVTGKGVSSRSDLKLDPAEVAEAAEGLKRKTEYSVDMLSWPKEDAEIHVSVMKRMSELLDSGSFTAEEAYVKAVMDITGESKSGAMKIIRRTRNCV